MFSMMARRPRAPDLRLSASRAIAASAPSVNLQVDALHLEELLVLPREGVLRLLQDANERLLVSSSSVAMTGRRPTNSGIKPELEQVLGLHLVQELAHRSVRPCDGYRHRSPCPSCRCGGG